MSDKKKILVYGAGAIGRGYVPWLFSSENFSLSFVEQNSNIRNLMLKNKSFKTYMTIKEDYKELTCNLENCFAPGDEDPQNYDGIITAVGPRQIFNLREILSQASCPVLFFENDSSLPGQLMSLTGNKNFFFGIPDVITSNTAPKSLQQNDPLAIVTENGTCFCDNAASFIGGDIAYVNKSELHKQWMAKLYMHNTPHCIAAYLGAINGKQYLHEGMKNKKIFSIVQGAMKEMEDTIVELYGIDREFASWYGNKELSRFSNELLFDPISRVAREPFRKLGLHDRLIGASQLSLSAGKIPENILLGIMAAFLYDEINDEDFHIKILIDALNPKDFLKLIININPHEALYKAMIDRWEKLKSTIGDIGNE